VIKSFSTDSVLGCIVGGAIGDAVGGVPERVALCLSDDTQLTLATCESIAARGDIDPSDIAATFLGWFRRRKLSGLGSSTLKALRDLDAGNHWALSGAKGERSAGNGAAMRIAPLAFLMDPDDRSHRVTIRDVSRITHHNDEAYLGALAVLCSIRSENWPDDVFAHLVRRLPDSRMRDRLTEVASLPEECSVAEVARRFGSSGYVVETVPLALAVARRMTEGDMAQALAELVELGGDSDTIGSIAGQVSGFHLGYERLPETLRDLEPVQAILPLAEAFAQSITART
jgi:ADP-ribosylglycohydrolase